MKILKCIAKAVLFIVTLFVLWKGLDYVLEKYSSWWDHTGMDGIYETENYYDVISVGSSITIINVSNEELYTKHGIAGATVGSPSQPTYISYFVLKETLKYQTPKVVLFDVNSLFYTEEEIAQQVTLDEQHYLHSKRQI